MIDESHHFRNNTKGRRDEEGNLIRKSRYERLMEDIIQSGVKTKALLLSATPVNNDLRDLRNQVYFLTEGQDAAFKESIGIASLQELLKAAQQQFSRWAKTQTSERKTGDLLERLSSAFFKLLDELTIARSRKHIQRYYKDTIAQLGGFPERLKPLSIYPEIDLENKFMSYDKLNDEISNYKLSLFNPSEYILSQFKDQYKTQYEIDFGPNFTQKNREYYLIGMMKVNFLKRLESSIRSFEITMTRTISKIEALEDQIREFKKSRSGDAEIDVEASEMEETGEEELQEAFEVGKKFKYKLAHLDLDRWLKDLQEDKRQLEILHLSAQAIDERRDAKLAELKKVIQAKVKNPTIDKRGRPNRKVLVFTAFADTAAYLYEALRDWAAKELGIHAAMVTGGPIGNKTTFGKNDFNHILTHFSPISKNRAKIKSMLQEGEIDLLIATDCISEGQNLQDCDYLINYDIHWNPVRIIQRFGWIDRIGSIHHAVQLVNFWPTHDLNKYINLKNRVEARMALVDIAATFEDNILNPDELQELIKDELKYRDKQLLRLKDEILDLEDFTESVALNEFTLDDFRIELTKYIENNRQKLQDAPLGLYAVVPTDPAYQVIGPGVIYCLKQKGDASGAETINPLQPYFLVYVRDDEIVRYAFAQPKQILEIFRTLCSGKTAPDEALCNLFDRQTRNGTDMSFYSRLLEKAVESIESTFRRRVAAGLQTGRDFIIPKEQNQPAETTDFELITWLVIKMP